MCSHLVILWSASEEGSKISQQLKRRIEVTERYPEIELAYLIG